MGQEKVIFWQNRELLLQFLEKAAKKIAPKEEFGLLFSGGVDSALLALVFKRLGLRFKCFFGFVEGLGKPKDLDYAIEVAKRLKVKLEASSIKLDLVPKLAAEIMPLIGTANPVQVGVALPIVLACKKASESGIKVVFSGMGADELFAGYAKFRSSKDIAEQSIELLEQLPEHDLQRDISVASHFGLQVRVPFLDPDVVRFALSLGKEFKLSGYENKVILRQLAVSLGLPEKIAERKKLAAQYGSNFDKALEKLAKKAKAGSKTAYLETLAGSNGIAAAYESKPKEKLPFSGGSQSFVPAGVGSKEKMPIAALSSGGKDSCLALWLMQKKGFEVRCLVSIIPDNPDSYMYHQPNLEMLLLQSRALGIPLVFERTSGEKEVELDALERVLGEAKAGYSIGGVATGALFSEYQSSRIKKVCDGLGLQVFSPLWHIDQVEELKMLVDAGFVFIISKVAGLNKDWLGRRIGKKEITELEKLSKRKGIHAAGEGGEFESLVLDAPNFKKKISILSMKKSFSSDLNGFITIEEAVLEEKV